MRFQSGSNRLDTAAQAIGETARRLVDLGQLSDASKGLLFRDREFEALHERLHEYLIRQDETSANAFLAEMDRRGYSDHLDRMRKEVAAARETTIEQKVDSAVGRVAKLIEASRARHRSTP